MKKIAFATVVILSTLTFFASSKESAEPQHRTILVAEKANFRQESLTNGVGNDPLTANKANLAQADYGND